jgi:ribosomal protein L11 methyltransferase
VPSFALTADVQEEDAEVIASLLWDLGTAGLEVRDTEAAPLPGVRGPAEGEAILIAAFGTEEEAETARAAVATAFPHTRLSLGGFVDEDWSLAWRARIRCTRVGRLWVGPPWQEAPKDAVALHIEPKMAFGTGDHPTTALCLAAVDDFLGQHQGCTVLDVGTGTGILALAARKLGAARVVAVDTDTLSVQLAKENAEANKIQGVEFSTMPLAEVEGRFDLVLANILANTLVEMAQPLAARLQKTLVLSGILHHQAEDVARAFAAEGLVQGPTATEGEWVCLVFQRTGA